MLEQSLLKEVPLQKTWKDKMKSTLTRNQSTKLNDPEGLNPLPGPY